MSAQRLSNYLRSYRRKSGLSQREVALLLGWKHGEQLSRYEKRHRLPTLHVALACEAVFDIPAAKLFAGARDAIARETKARARALAMAKRKAVTGNPSWAENCLRYAPSGRSVRGPRQAGDRPSAAAGWET